MKKAFFFLTSMWMMIAGWNKSQAQAPDPYTPGIKINYIRTWDARAPETNPNAFMARPLKDVKQTTAYYDGLGRLLQTVVKQGSLETGNTPADMVTPVVYDEVGREQYQYLPFVANNTGGNTSISDGLFKMNPFQQQAASMQSQYGAQGETYFYNKMNFEASALNRVDKLMPAGNNWIGSNRGVETKYWVNVIADEVRIWQVTNNTGTLGTYSTPGTYQPGQLIKNVTINEHGKQVIEFKDKENKLILKKVQLTAVADNGNGDGHGGWLCTYYIHDELNLLRAVIQPKGVELISSNWSLISDPTILAEQCFRYEYDQRRRAVIKKIPGGSETWAVYDARDRVVLLQDGKQRSQGKWMYMQYDEMNRPKATGLWNNGQDRIYHSGQAVASTSYPNLSGQSYEELTNSFYDNYDWRSLYGNPLSTTYDNTYNGLLMTPSNTSWPYAQDNIPSSLLKGRMTGTRTKVLGTSTYLFTVNIFNEKGRVIQVYEDNVSGGIDVETNQYTWAGYTAAVVSKTEKAGTNAQTIVVATKMTRDDLGRVIKTDERVSHSLVNNGHMGFTKTIAQFEYNKFGQLKKKILSPTGGPGGTPLETFNYEYNIRGWLQGVNKAYLADAGSNYFGFELGYDKTTNAANRNFLAAQYNGNITGMIWRSQGDQVKRKYDFGYDAANRLLKGDFEQNDNGSNWGNSNVNYSVKMGDGVNPLSAYDANGNILRVQQWGYKITGSAQIDDLTYLYQNNGISNKLARVTDANNDPATKLGDFKDGTNSDDDYSYDINGNLVLDKNKKIDLIDYNYLNLPQGILIRDNSNVSNGIGYVYDAGGKKLKKEVYAGGVPPAIVTLYIGRSVFQDNVLQYTAHGEGRIRFKPATSSSPAMLIYDYFVKDHLGNVRMILTEEQRQDIYPATTLENVTYNGGTAVSIEDDYYSIDASKVVDQSVATGMPVYQNNNGNPPYNNNPYSNTAANSARLYQLNATTNTMNNKTGLGIVLKVMAGDNINIYGKSYHKQPVSGYTSPTNAIPVLDLINAFAGASIVSSKGVTGSQITGQPGFPVTLSGLIGNQPPQASNLPRASINWIILDEQFKYQSGGFDMVGTAVNTSGTYKNHDLSTIPTISIPKSGYIYVYCSNESQYDVFFDNLQVFHTRSPLLEETHYYPFGLAMAGISSSALNILENKRKFNDGTEFESKELSDGSGLDLYATEFRMYNPQIGRFHQPDALTDLNVNWSPYHFAANNPALFNDPLGLDTIRGALPPGYEPKPGDVHIPGDGSDPNAQVYIYDSDRGWTAEIVEGNVTVTGKPGLNGGKYDGKKFADIETKSFGKNGYSQYIGKQQLAHAQVAPHIRSLVKELFILMAVYSMGTAYTGGSALELRSHEDYKKLLKFLRGRGSLVINGRMLVIGTIMGIRADQMKDQAIDLLDVLFNYVELHGEDVTGLQGIYIITDSYSVGCMGGQGGGESISYYDISTRKYLGGTYMRY